VEIVNEELALEVSRNLSRANVVKVRERRLNLNDLQVLSLLCGQPMTVYVLRRKLKESFGIIRSFGTLYPRLQHLENLELVIGTWDQRKHTYCITQAGKVEAAKGVQSLLDASNLMESMIQPGRELSPLGDSFLENDLSQNSISFVS
jgi:DNA-binding PadR family transcriptional regulator